MTDMCVNSCIGFTGPFRDKTICPVCQEARYENVRQKNKVSTQPRKQFITIPIGPQIQAQWRSEKAAYNMGHRRRAMEWIVDKITQSLPIDEYSDIYSSEEFTRAVLEGDIKPDDTVLMLSIDGAQLYQHK
jgi:hypothetical protein